MTFYCILQKYVMLWVTFSSSSLEKALPSEKHALQGVPGVKRYALYVHVGTSHLCV